MNEYTHFPHGFLTETVPFYEFISFTRGSAAFDYSCLFVDGSSRIGCHR